MSNKLSAMERYEIGQPIFKELFTLSSKDLKSRISEICGSLVPDHMFDSSASVKKYITDDEPDKIEIWNYDCIYISAFGINFNPEHSTGKTIVEFNKFFKL